MKCGESRGRSYVAQPTVTLLRQRSAEIPASTDAAAQAGSGPAPAVRQTILTPAHPRRGLGRFLVVDDNEVIRRLIAANLTLEGFDVTTAVDGQDCLEKVPASATQAPRADAYLAKPFDAAEMIRIVRELASMTGTTALPEPIQDAESSPSCMR